MVWLPAASELTDTRATPPDTVAGLPVFTPSTASCTVPPGEPSPGATGFTLIWKLSAWPATGLTTDGAIEVVVWACWTVWSVGAEELTAKLSSLP